MNLIALNDSKLARLHRQTENEIARRTAAATEGHDAASIVCGNEMAKRALIVAAAGAHSILLVGPPSCGKTMLRAVALKLDLTNTFEARPCPCGYRSDPFVVCRCTIRQVARHVRRLPDVDITLDLQRPSQRELKFAGMSLVDMQQQIAEKSRYESSELDEDSGNLLRAAVAEFALDVEVQQRIVAVARTVANLDRSEWIKPSHLCEAINYRMLMR
jgi:predicted ATPase with chaperone activity